MIEMLNGRIAAGSRVVRFCSWPTCGFSAHQATAAVIATFSTDFRNCTRPSTPNSRLNPVRGETLENSGFSLAPVHSTPCWTTLPAMPETAAAPTTTASTGAVGVLRMAVMAAAPPSSNWNESGRSMNGSSRWVRSWAIQPPASTSAPAVPARVDQEVRSIDLATSPCRRASSSRRGVGSSVRFDRSSSSAMAGQTNGRRNSS